ncbi:hypothetical protein Tco_0911862 [Tanacetum coccineum]
MIIGVKPTRLPGFGVQLILTLTSVRVLGGEDYRWSGGGRGVKEKNKVVATKDVATPHVDAAMKVVSPSVVEETVAMECPMVNTPGVGSNPPPPTQEANAPASNAPDKPSYATATGKPIGKKVNVRTLYTPGGNGIDVVVPMDSIRAISERFANTVYGFFLRKKVAYPVVANYHPDENLLKEDVSTVPVWVKLHGVHVTAFSKDDLSAIATILGRSSYARVMIELQADVELKDNIIVAMPKITREGHYTCDGEKKTVKKPSQTSRGVPVGPKMGFKPQKEYRPVTKKPNTSSSGNKKKGMEPTIEVSNSNSFDVLNSVDNDVEFGKHRLLDNDRNPLVHTGIVESDSEVKVGFDETANLRIPTSGKDGSDKGYGTNNLLEQLRDSYPDNDDYDPYDDDMYENHDLSKHL